ncbi:hypothetical protein MTP10_19040 [Nonomuraea sp. 3-1Str]|uniref:hypothetical protein n=1 Tax=Nonomuraea sp. 3-1Str TaxID=2929801 RepID=UPI002857E253|nr:hypothetical protein [Nonomuraea sp. 3-1Str]MDR8410823.1 hypothetical protein [Nonomuraea sp. 3-1Str]
MRNWSCVVLMGTLLTCLTGCTVAANGYVGISVDESGHLVAVLAWCGPAPDGVRLYHERAVPQRSPTGNPDGAYIDDAMYHASAMRGQSASFRLDTPVGDWMVTPKSPSLDPAITYNAYGFTNDNTSSLRHVTFEIDDATKVDPGQVLIQRWDEKRQQDIDVVISLAAFEQMGQDPENCP